MAILTDNTALGTILKEIEGISDANRYNDLFVQLIAALRPGKMASAGDRVQYLIDRLDQEMALRNALQQLIFGLLEQRDCHSLFTQAGILSRNGFFTEFIKHIKHQILPIAPDKRSMEYTIQLAFYNKKDYEWVNDVPERQWMALFTLLSMDMGRRSSKLNDSLCDALGVLSYRVSSAGLEDEIMQQVAAEEWLRSPFLEQNSNTLQLLEAFKNNDYTTANAHAVKVRDILNECDGILKTIRNNSARFGTSLDQTYLLVRLEEQILRMRYLVVLLRTDNNIEWELRTSVTFFKEIIEGENKRNSVKDLVQKSIGMLAYQVAEHKGNTGEKYITSSRKDYRHAFYAAMGGGAIISFIAMFKTLLHYVPSAPFWSYFWFGLNYAMGFVLLQVTHTTLATKQPAMTASALASYMDERKQQQPSLHRLAHSFVLVWRSQTASFVGNLLIVFPLSYLLAYTWPYIFGHKMINDATAYSYLTNQSPLRSLAWIYACITGVFLFLSGIISGYVDNKVRYSNIPGRIREHPLLRRALSGKKRNAIARYADTNLGGWAGNICLGFFLGFAPLIGKTFGIPFDIRHITISTAQIGFGLCGLGNKLPTSMLVEVIIGVLGIGFLNFLVSFSLAYWVALRSRGINIRQHLKVIRLILYYFRKYPLDFIRPPRKGREAADVYGVEE